MTLPPRAAKKTTDIIVVNALPQTLDHYQGEFETIVRSMPGVWISRVITERGDGQQSAASKMYAAVNILVSRLLLYSGGPHQTFIVVWPLFGYLDVLTWIRLARRSPIVMIIHDPLPLREQIGYSTLSAKMFKLVSRLKNIHILTHTTNAQQALLGATGVLASVAPHPMYAQTKKLRVTEKESSRKVVRILGQYKETRSLHPVRQIAETLGEDNYRLEILGRGWPDQNGWVVVDRFLSATDFDNSIRTADCVVIPYSRFYQSGVAVRCLESLVPIVGPRHPHLEELYGKEWPGLVDGEDNWAEAILNVTSPELSQNIEDLRGAAFEGSITRWQRFLKSKLNNLNAAGADQR